MIIWTGLGFLVALVGLGCLFLTETITRVVFDESYYQVHGWPKLAGFLVAALFVYVIGLLLDRQSVRVLIDKATGQEVVLKKMHSLFFIPVSYWPYIFVALGVVFLFVKA